MVIGRTRVRWLSYDHYSYPNDQARRGITGIRGCRGNGTKLGRLSPLFQLSIRDFTRCPRNVSLQLLHLKHWDASNLWTGTAIRHSSWIVNLSKSINIYLLKSSTFVTLKSAQRLSTDSPHKKKKKNTTPRASEPPHGPGANSLPVVRPDPL